MPPWAQIALVVCAVVLTAVLVAALLALRRTAVRAESLMRAVEGEVKPLTVEATALLAEARTLSQQANVEMKRVTTIVDRAEVISGTAVRMAQAVGGLTRVGQTVALLAGLRRGVDVFVTRLKKR
jgi:uncharacterized protein YoxC